MDHFEQIYAHKADAYQHMIAAEDTDGNLLKALQGLTDLNGVYLVDIGSGTGRIPSLLYPYSNHITCLDKSYAMLEENRLVSQKYGSYWHLVQGDMVHIPITSGQTDLVTAGWAMGHFCAWYPNDWKNRMVSALQEMLRLLKPSGLLIIFETLGTGVTEPGAPNSDLAAYYSWLESDWGFKQTTLSTDYLFPSTEAAAAATGFFFGSELAERIMQNGWRRLPEWTGMWSRTKG